MFTSLVLISLSLPMLISSSSLSCDERTPCVPNWYEYDVCVPSHKWCDSVCDCRNCKDERSCESKNCAILNKTSEEIVYIPEMMAPNKCWNIDVPFNKYLRLKFRLSMNDENCILVKERRLFVTEEKLFICGRNFTAVKYIETIAQTEITFLRRMASNEEKLMIEYNIAGVLCKRSDAFKCSMDSCIEPEKKCDGNPDCLNGLDEVGCERGVLAVEGVKTSRNLALRWLRNQRTAAWGWRQNTHRAVTAMYLANGANFNGTNKEEDLTAKQLELQMFTAILRNGTDVVTPTQLSMFIHALIVICHNPRNFYGYNLVSELQKQVRMSKQLHPITYLALCNAGVAFSQDDVDKLLSVLNGLSQHGFNTDMDAITTISLSCLSQNNQFANLKENLTSVTKSFKEMQMADGSFGNVYTTALVVQALLASGEEETRDWNLKSAIEFLKEKQDKDNGSFGDFLATYLVLPILNGKSLLDIGKVNCTENLKMPRNGNHVSNIDSKFGSNISVNYFMCIGNQKDQLHPLFLRVPENITVLEFMRLAADADSKYKFKYETIRNKVYIYEISGIINDPEDGKFWQLYTGKNKDAIEIETQSADKINIHDQEHVVMWYKSAKLL